MLHSVNYWWSTAAAFEAESKKEVKILQVWNIHQPHSSHTALLKMAAEWTEMLQKEALCICGDFVQSF